MSDEIKAATRRFYEEVMNRKNLDAMDELCAPNLVDRTAMPGQAPGVKGVKDMFSTFIKAFPDMTVTVEEVIAEGDVAAARFSGSATHKGELFGTAPTGKTISFHGIDMMRFKNGKVTEVWHQGDDLIALMQLGIKLPGM